jgi:hypothetical protein
MFEVPCTDQARDCGQNTEHRYLLPLTPEMKTFVEKLKKPYPKLAVSRDIAAPDFQSGEAWGSTERGATAKTTSRDAIIKDPRNGTFSV